MKCPHCLVEISPKSEEIPLGRDIESSWSVIWMICPNNECGKMIIEIANGVPFGGPDGLLRIVEGKYIAKPIMSSRQAVPVEVDDLFARDYIEAGLILSLSPKASAALSRRCLQNILREKARVKQGNLSNEIQQVLDSNSLPSYLADSIDAVRNIGNFAAHPLKSTSTGEIVEVESGEAEWLLEVIESLFDFYFVQPARLLAKKDKLNAKLADMGKPPMK